MDRRRSSYGGSAIRASRRTASHLEGSQRGWLVRFARDELEELLQTLREGEDETDWPPRPPRSQAPARGPASYKHTGIPHRPAAILLGARR